MKIAPKVRSDQWNADDFLGGPRTFTIAGAKQGTAEGPYDIELVEGEGRVWRPPNSVLGALILAWGTDESADWIGRRVTLYRDPSVTFGNEKPGGIRVSHASHLTETTTVRVTVSRGRKSPVTIEPLTDAVAKTTRSVKPPTAAQVAATTDLDELRAMWKSATPEIQALITARKQELDALAKDGAE